jgi:hypothetical protein
MFNGKPDDAIAYYLEQEEKKKRELKKKEIKIDDTPFYWKLIPPTDKIHHITHFWLVNNKKSTTSKTGDTLAIEIAFQLNYIPKNLIVGISIWNIDETYITAMSTDMNNIKLKSDDGIYNVTLEFHNILNPNQYICAIAIHDGMEYLYRQLNETLSVLSNKKRNFGLISMEHKWTIHA